MKLKHISFMRLVSRHGDLGNLADMLRYDVAFQSKAEPGLVAFPVFQTKHGNLGGHITYGRWDSFGVLVKYLGGEEDTPSVHPMSQWFTYCHPRDQNGQVDYGRLVSVTLEAYVNAKDLDSIPERGVYEQSG